MVRLSATVSAGGVISIIAAAVFWKWLPQIRQGARQLIVAQQMSGGPPGQPVVMAPPSSR